MKSYFRLPKISLLAVVMLATIVPALLVVRGSLAHAAGTNNQIATVNPTLSTSTSTVRVGQTIVVQGQGFTPNENMNLELDASTITNLGSIPCDSTGTCQGSVTLNLYQPITQGTYLLVATGDTSGATVQALLRFNPEIFLSVPQGEQKQDKLQRPIRHRSRLVLALI